MQSNVLIFIIVAIIIISLAIVLVLFRRKNRDTASSAGSEQIYIGNLPYRANDRELRKHFSHYGNVTDVRIVKDRRTGRSKGYAFITFSNSREAKKSLAAHGKEFGGRSLVVHIAKPR